MGKVILLLLVRNFEMENKMLKVYNGKCLWGIIKADYVQNYITTTTSDAAIQAPKYQISYFVSLHTQQHSVIVSRLFCFNFVVFVATPYLNKVSIIH